ncbi:nitrate- and nitrite sensing domain-containing protein [Sulfurimonas sp. HSL-1716]|uniref:nitrate- and nitrite sensing domain-containing protein n=1 Tax=Hydrocurvibacter sulfurireducens TaxID=3131937 RepID=UPI0031F7AE5D
MISTQRTRGLTNSYLNGNDTVLLLIYNGRDEMKRAIGTMESLPIAADPVINSRATSISQALIKLNNKALKLHANDVFADYSEQIGQILMLAQSVNKRNTKDLNAFAKESSSIMMEIMLPMTEYVGQLRGYGSGIAAKGNIKKEEFEHISLLIHEIQKFNEKLKIQINKLIHDFPKESSVDMPEEIEAVYQAAKDYTELTEDKFSKDAISVDSNNYFDRGTKLISLIIQAYNTSNEAILKDSKGWL